VLDLTLHPHRFCSRARREEAARSLLAHTSSLSPPLTTMTLGPNRSPLGRTPTGHRWDGEGKR
jgi:hypothetical protein